MVVLRAEKISYLQCLIPESTAKSFVYNLGKLEIMSFVDLQKEVVPFKKKYSHVISKLEELQSMVNKILEVTDDFNFHSKIYNIKTGIHTLSSNVEFTKSAFDHMEKEIREYHTTVLSHKTALTKLTAEHEKWDDYLAILQNLNHLSSDFEQATTTITDTMKGSKSNGKTINLQPDNPFDSLKRQSSKEVEKKEENGNLVELVSRDLGFYYISGVCDQAKFAGISLQVQQFAKGNVYLTTEVHGTSKIIFLFFVVGHSLRNKIYRLFELHNVQLHDVSGLNKNMTKTVKKVKQRVAELSHIKIKTLKELEKVINACVPELSSWKKKLSQEKQVYLELNKFAPGPSNETLVIEGWVPSLQKELVSKVLNHLTMEECEKHIWVINELPSNGPVPSHLPTNKFTKVFQSIISAYGVPRIGELNPAAFSLFIFPFLAGFMFADLFHGTVLFFVALILCCLENRLKDYEKDDGLVGYAYSARYFLLIMGMCSIFTGFLYNDFSCMRLGIFTSSFSTSGNRIPGTVYPLGMDYKWEDTVDESTFNNSIKMKLSIIIGFFHMTLGMLLDCCNQYYFKDFKTLFLQSIPQLTTFLFSFGYMVFLIYYKMFHDQKTNVSVIKIFIDMVMFKSDKDTLLFSSLFIQNIIQKTVFFSCIFSVLLLLFGKPFYFLLFDKKRNLLRSLIQNSLKKKENSKVTYSERSLFETETLSTIKRTSDITFDDGEQGEEADTFFSILGTQSIHTLEICISMISHLTSYLRLWAIGLSHTELTRIVQHKFINDRLGDNPILFIVTSQLFGMATCTALFGLGVFECFLHALRLQWIEFQSKFFHGDGISFEAFKLEQKED
eukprot:GAHX01000243.1.p1 GENE.GAHX01000243.1~~GAHX01000243.1.p1  ORF type:complete len:839 (+),score=161.11 GAHX01000243.1:63-2579(+)